MTGGWVRPAQDGFGMHTIADRLTLQGESIMATAGQRVADRELLSAVYDRCATKTPSFGRQFC